MAPSAELFSQSRQFVHFARKALVLETMPPGAKREAVKRSASQEARDTEAKAEKRRERQAKKNRKAHFYFPSHAAGGALTTGWAYFSSLYII